MAVTLDNLHDDIVHQVCSYMYFPYLYLRDERWYTEWMKEDNPAFGLLPLSLVCKRLRAQTLPWIFRDVTFSLRKPPIPSHIWPYILVFRFCDVEPPDAPRPRKTEMDLIQIRRDAGEQLAKLPSVHAVHLWVSSPSEAIMLALPALQGRLYSLVLYNYWFMNSQDIPFPQLQGLRRLIHVDNVVKRYFLSPDEPCHETLGELLFTTVESSASSLIHLDIPAQHTRLDNLGGLRMASLHTLVLRGRVQSPGPKLMPLILNAVPNLRVLEIHLYVIGGDTPQFTVMTEEVHLELDGRRTPILSNLRKLVLANANPFDYIFLHLPTDLQLLSLPAVAFHRERRGRSELALSAETASHVLTRCTPSPLPELMISIQGELPLWLFAMIANAFPRLQKLELRQRFRVDENGEEIKEEHPPESYATALAVFTHLQVLNLDWPLTNDGSPDELPSFRYLRYPYDPPDPVERRDIAALVARCVTPLQEIRFRENYTAAGTTALPWLPFSILHSGSDSEPKITKLNNNRPDYAYDK